jgi:hypothetical protein
MAKTKLWQELDGQKWTFPNEKNNICTAQQIPAFFFEANTVGEFPTA